MHPPASTIFILTVQFGHYEANISQECSVFLPDSSYIQTVKVILQGWTVGTTCQSEPYHTSKVSLLYNIPCCSLIVTQRKLVSRYFFKTKRWFFFSLFKWKKAFHLHSLFILNFCSTLQHKVSDIYLFVTFYIYIYI